MSLNFYGYDKGSKLMRCTDDLVNFLVSKNHPAVIAAQESGNSLSGDVKEIELLQKMKANGYDSIHAVEPVKNPVNVRLFFNKEVLTFVRKLPPFYLAGFLNRQVGAVFQTRTGKRLAIFSVHLPLFERFPEDKLRMSNALITLAKTQVSDVDYTVIAGDFNESNLGNPTMLAGKIEELGQYLRITGDSAASWRNKKLDNIFLSKNLKLLEQNTLKNSVSDHSAVVCTVLV